MEMLQARILERVAFPFSRASSQPRDHTQVSCTAGRIQEPPVQFLGREDLLEKGQAATPVFLGFPGGSAGRESPCNVGDLDSIPALARSPGEGKGYPLQYFDLENSTDCIVHGLAKSRTRLSHFRKR